MIFIRIVIKINPKDEKVDKIAPNGAKREPKGAKRRPNGAKREPNGTQREPNGVQREPNGAQKEPKGCPKGAKWRSKCIKKSMPEKGRQKEGKMYHHLILFGQFSVQNPSKMHQQIDAKIDTETNMKFH